MKKFQSLKLMLLTLFGLICTTAFAQKTLNSEFAFGNYNYKVTKAPSATDLTEDGAKKGTVTVLTITEDAKDAIGTNQSTLITTVNGKLVLDFPGHFTYVNGNETYYFEVTKMDANLFHDAVYDVNEMVIPKELTEIPTAAFNTLTNLEKLTFEAGSKVQTIANQAFASTHIDYFDFSPCLELTGLSDEVFVEASTAQPNENENTWIKKVKVPGSDNPLFKHIGGAFRNLPNLEEIENLSESWVEEIVADAFRKDTKLKNLSLSKHVKYVDVVALRGSGIENLTVDVTSLQSLGGVTINPETYAPEASQYPETNLYGETDPTADGYNGPYATLQSLTLKGTLIGTIASYAFAWCDDLAVEDDEDEDEEVFDISGLYFGSKAQIQANAFLSSEGIGGADNTLTINPINDNRLDAGKFTIDADAFKDCNIVNLELKKIATAYAIGAGAFGDDLEHVTIGTVTANGNAAFDTGAFVFAGVDGTWLKLATGGGESLSAQNTASALIAAGAFDFTAVDDADPVVTVLPYVEIGEIASQGGVFAEGAIVGASVEKVTFVGPIIQNGLDTKFLAAEAAAGAGDGDGNDGTGGDGGDGDQDAAEHMLTTLIFKDKIGTNGIGGGVFAGFTNLEEVTFNGLMDKLAVASGSFTGSGKETTTGEGDNAVTTSDLVVTYDLNDVIIEDYTVNPFATDAFGGEEFNPAAKRIISWVVTDTRLNARITAAIEQAVKIAAGEEYEGEVYPNMAQFNVYKWKATSEDVEGTYFIVFEDWKVTNTHPNPNNKIAWGRYDLGKFELEPGPDFDPTQVPIVDGEPGTQNANDGYMGMIENGMIIPRYQETTGTKVKLTIYGLYSDEDNFEEVSSVYMVPLQVTDGHYFIDKNNTNLLIIKAENIGEENFDKHDVKIYYTDANYLDEDGDETQDEGEIVLNDQSNSVWNQLTTRQNPFTNDNNPFKKADISWTNQQLIDQAAQLVDGNPVEAPNIYDEQGKAGGNIVKDLWIMSNPAKYTGFRVDEASIERGGAYIGLGWYYTLLSYPKTEATQAARVIWLDDTQATAIFGVKKDGKVSLKGINDGAIYNLQGIRVMNPAKGLYIQNGKKFVVK